MGKISYQKFFRFELGSVLLILFGMILLLNPDFGSAALATILGWILVGGGAAGLALGCISWPALGIAELIGSLIVLCCGIYLLRNPLMLASLAGVLLGLLMISQGLGSLRDGLQVKRYGGKYQFSVILSIGMLILGVYLILSPMATSRFVMKMAGLIMIASGISNLISHHRAQKYITDSRKKIIGNSKIIDAEE